jgi:hypothetical protein
MALLTGRWGIGVLGCWGKTYESQSFLPHYPVTPSPQCLYNSQKSHGFIPQNCKGRVRIVHDTIILQLTQKFEEQTKLLEDMRHHSLWSRVKTAFGFAAS